MMFHLSVSKIPWKSFSASLLRSVSARCLCHSSGSRSNVAGFRSSSGKNSLVDFSAPAATGAAAAIVDAATAAPVVARNSRRLIIASPSASHACSSSESLTARLITHFAEFEKQTLLAQSDSEEQNGVAVQKGALKRWRKGRIGGRIAPGLISPRSPCGGAKTAVEEARLCLVFLCEIAAPRHESR